MSNPTFVYWNVASRAQLPMLILRASNVEYEWDVATANTWPAPKDKMPFGQLPVLRDNGLVLAQSGAIARYCAKMARLWPSNDPNEEALADSTMEHCNDMFSEFAKAKYNPNPVKAWTTVQEVTFPKQLQSLEKMLTEERPYFGGQLPNVADIAVFNIVLLARRAGFDSSLLNLFPGIQRVVDRVQEMGSIREYMEQNVPSYFTIKTTI